MGFSHPQRRFILTHYKKIYMATTIISGLLGGLIATIAMTIVMMAAGDDSPPPTATLWSKYIGDKEPQNYMMQGMALHLLYGVVAGGVLAAALMLTDTGVTSSLPLSIAIGAVYGFLLFVIGALFWMNIILRLEPERCQITQFFLLHEIYGITLGAWLALTPI